MALGGGLFTKQNKILPGSYINFISLARANAMLLDRGVAAMGLLLDWGKDDEIMTVTAADFQKHSKVLFGYDYAHAKMRPLRELFHNIHTLYAYKLNSADTGKATCEFATALHSGTRGNALQIVISKNLDDTSKFDVQTLFGGVKVDEQTVTAATGLVPNDYVTFKTGATLTATAGTPLAGGVTGAATVSNHQSFLDKVEKYSFNTIGAVSDERSSATGVNALYAAFTKRMRDEMGVKFQAVLFNHAADTEAVVNVKNAVKDDGVSPASLVYWVTGVVAGTAINKSATNVEYGGEYTVDVDYTQVELETAILSGEFALHQVGQAVRVLRDVNSLLTLTEEKGEVFKDNQTIRVIDNIANDIAVLFNTKYLGRIQNNAAGRTSLWADIVKHHQQLEEMGAIEDFNDKDIVVEPGDHKRAVKVSDAVTIVNAMEQLYMTCIVG